jgi:hypothetical protein
LCLLARWRGWILSDHVAWRRFLSRRRKGSDEGELA